MAWIAGLDAAAWSLPDTAEELERRETALAEELTAQGIPFYRAPFAERPDYAFLRAPRRRPLINVDDA